MADAQIIIIPAVLSTKQCYDYCGGQPVFEELHAKHGDLVRPVRTTERGDSYYRRVSIDAALAIAEQAGTLINPAAAERKLLIKTKQARRFK